MKKNKRIEWNFLKLLQNLWFETYKSKHFQIWRSTWFQSQQIQNQFKSFLWLYLKIFNFVFKPLEIILRKCFKIIKSTLIKLFCFVVITYKFKNMFSFYAIWIFRSQNLFCVFLIFISFEFSNKDVFASFSIYVRT